MGVFVIWLPQEEEVDEEEEDGGMYLDRLRQHQHLLRLPVHAPRGPRDKVKYRHQQLPHRRGDGDEGVDDLTCFHNKKKEPGLLNEQNK